METWQRSGEKPLFTDQARVNPRAHMVFHEYPANRHAIPRFLVCRMLWTSLRSFSLYLYVVLIRLIAIRFSEVLVGCCCIYFTIIKFMAYDTDTTYLSNAFFALLGPLALLAFAFANMLEKQDVAREKLALAGARSFHGAVLLMWATVLKYALLHIKSLPGIPAGSAVSFALDLTLGLMAGILFLLAAIESFAALRSVSDLLVIRLLDEPILLKLHDGAAGDAFSLPPNGDQLAGENAAAR